MKRVLASTLFLLIRGLDNGVNHTFATNFLDGYGSTQTGGIAETRPVITYTLDSLLHWFPPPDVLKIDVEGAELEVLLGGVEMFASYKPVILLEVAQATSKEVASLLKSMQYRLYDSDAPRKIGRNLIVHHGIHLRFPIVEEVLPFMATARTEITGISPYGRGDLATDT